MKKAQVALEYLVIISFGLMVLIPLAIYLRGSASNYSNDVNLILASQSLEKLGQAIDWVNLQGEPAKIKVKILIPNQVENISFLGRVMVWKVRTPAGVSDLYYVATANLTGSLPTLPGIYEVMVEAEEGGVRVYVG